MRLYDVGPVALDDSAQLREHARVEAKALAYHFDLDARLARRRDERARRESVAAFMRRLPRAALKGDERDLGRGLAVRAERASASAELYEVLRGAAHGRR